jgi:hypothetical protein
VCILMDGREQASVSMKDFLQVRGGGAVSTGAAQHPPALSPPHRPRPQHEMKIYDPSILRTVHHGRPVVMHVFERSVELPKHASQREYHMPLQVRCRRCIRAGQRCVCCSMSRSFPHHERSACWR